MANEIKIALGPSNTTATVTVDLIDPTGAAVTPALTAAHTTSGVYMASMPAGAAAGEYVFNVSVGGQYRHSGNILWSGTQAVNALTLPGLIADAVWRTHMDGTGANAIDVKNALYQVHATTTGLAGGFRAAGLPPSPVSVDIYGPDGTAAGPVLQYQTDAGDRSSKTINKTV